MTVTRGLCLPFEFRRPTLAAVAALLCATLMACAHGQTNPTLGQVDADKFLFDSGTEQLGKKNWLTAREYFRRLVDSYPQSAYRADAKLGIGDTYIGENRVDSLILAVNEFREFLQFYPLNTRADYAQYRLAYAQSKQMLRPERDQTATHETLVEVQHFIDSFPNSQYRPEVDKIFREARDRLSDAEFGVGMTYFRGRWLPGALSRFAVVLRDDPEYYRRDEVYFYTAEALYKMGRNPEALPYYERLVEEYPHSHLIQKAQERIDEIKR
jgi:outer membrane protein assembly factor BamD